MNVITDPRCTCGHPASMHHFERPPGVQTARRAKCAWAECPCQIYAPVMNAPATPARLDVGVRRQSAHVAER